MTDAELIARISTDPGVMVGKPVIRGTRLTVEFVLGLLAHGMSPHDLLTEYAGLHEDDIHACLLFASQFLASTEFVPSTAHP